MGSAKENAMPEFLSSPSFIWFIIGFVFLLAELAAPAFIIIFFGLGAWVAAVAVWLFGIGLDYQITVFLVASVLFVVVLRRLWMRVFKGISGGDADEEKLDSPSNVGAVVEVTRVVAPSAPGEIKYRGTFWRAVSDVTIAEGKPAVIVEESTTDRSTFKVGPYTPASSERKIK